MIQPDKRYVQRYLLLAEKLHATFPGRLILDPDPPNSVKAIWSPPASAAEQLQFDTIVLGWDWTPRKPRSTAALVQDIETWIEAAATTGGQLQRIKRVAAVALALALQQRPREAEDSNVPVSGDEPEVI